MPAATTIELRAPTPRDRAEFIAAMRASRGLHHPWLVAPVSDEAFAGLLRRNRDERFATLLACRRADGAIVGYFNIAEIVRGSFQSAYLSYAAVAAHSRRGYMTQGLELVLRMPSPGSACTASRPTSSPPTRRRSLWWRAAALSGRACRSAT